MTPAQRGTPGAAPQGRYAADVLATGWRTAGRTAPRPVPAEVGLVVEDAQSGWVGAVLTVEKAGGMRVVHLEDRHGRSRAFPLGPGFLLDGVPVELAPPNPPARPTAPTRTASGSRTVANAPARVAAGSRIFVEGRHDAELVEKVWGDDLRVEGVVVEMLGGVDDLAGAITAFDPGPGRRMGVLVDHLVPGSKESRLVEEALRLRRYAPYVCILGHPYVDVWQSVRPQRLGWTAWPVVPRGRSWKHEVLAALQLPNQTQTDVARGWAAILATVRSYADLEPALLARVEELIDFVTAP